MFIGQDYWLPINIMIYYGIQYTRDLEPILLRRLSSKKNTNLRKDMTALRNLVYKKKYNKLLCGITGRKLYQCLLTRIISYLLTQ